MKNLEILPETPNHSRSKKGLKRSVHNESFSSHKIKQDRKILILINIAILINLLTLGVIYYSLNYTENFKKDINAATVLTPSPTQPGAIAYNNSSSACAYAKPGALILAGRSNYGESCFKQVSSAGGHVLIYIDAVLHNSTGRYHSLLYNNSECGSAAPLWPGGLTFNSYGKAADFRVGSIVQQKLECVLEKMVAENPHMAGFFADDLGSANGPLQNSAFNKEDWYQGAVALSKTFRKVANKHNLLFIVNGVWQGGSQQGGYPDRSQNGNALADGVCVEHHPVIEGSYSWPNFLKAPQWADQSPVTNGVPFHFVIAFDYQFSGWKNYSDNGAAWLTSQAGDSGYSSAPAPWGSFHLTGLPTKVGSSTTTPPTGGGTTGGTTGGSTGGSTTPNTGSTPSTNTGGNTNTTTPGSNNQITNIQPIPDNIEKKEDGSIVADFNNDQKPDVAIDKNNDNLIDPSSEIFFDGATDPTIVGQISESSEGIASVQQNSENGVNIGPLKLGSDMNKVLSTLLIIGGVVSVLSISTYIAIMKLNFFAGFRSNMGW